MLTPLFVLRILWLVSCSFVYLGCCSETRFVVLLQNSMHFLFQTVGIDSMFIHACSWIGIPGNHVFYKDLPHLCGLHSITKVRDTHIDPSYDFRSYDSFRSWSSPNISLLEINKKNHHFATCLNYFSITTKHHDQDCLENKALNWDRLHFQRVSLCPSW